ncbi:glycosyltransferase WbuB [Aliifodinibius salipaludis]|uniref:Glycosyltransferase WbuB n=1 Tax=Fodinibius salipaludis TaxID=2032627 RepID=A0A2A2G9P8_9BACT|nr:glycosyltransferase family 4 protein [Aliifodinibius salipaludis]PAU94028.1 glycosyltransferase WbuB [Aliifodinibius salipaludis]
MNILFITIAWPEKGQSNIYSDLIHKFIEEGHNVCVITNRPRRNKKSAGYTIEKGVKVLRIKTGNIAKTHPIEKSLSLLLLGWQFRRGIKKHFGNESFDLILFNTPPITLSRLMKDLKEEYNCALYLLLKDIWPYGFADMGLIKKHGWIYNYFRKHERRLYKAADVIGCMSPKGVDFILNQHPYLEAGKLEVCPNSISLNGNGIKKNSSISIREKYGIPNDATVFLFSGNLGLGHGLDYLSETILKMKDYKKAFFMIGGAGTYYSKLKKVFDKENPPNALLYSYLPEEEYKALITTCDVGLILLDSKYTYPQFPSRLLSYLENKMAVLCAVNGETDIGEIVEEYEAGITTIHGDYKSFRSAIERLCEDKQVVKKMGQQAWQLLNEKYEVTHSYQTIVKHFE